jgi:hypothetical protein
MTIKLERILTSSVESLVAGNEQNARNCKLYGIHASGIKEEGKSIIEYFAEKVPKDVSYVCGYHFACSPVVEDGQQKIYYEASGVGVDLPFGLRLS